MKLTTKNLIFVIALVACVSLMIAPVMAETLTGTLGTGDIGWDTKSYYATSDNTGYPLDSDPLQIYFSNIEYSTRFKSIILFSGWSFSNATVVSAQVPCRLYSGDETFGNGTIGFYRTFTGTPPTEVYNYLYIILDDYSPKSYTESKIIFIEYNATLLYNPTHGAMGLNGLLSDIPTSGAAFWAPNGAFSGYVYGNYTFNRELSFNNAYSATKPSGLGITGSVNKTVNGVSYISQASIVNALDNNLISSDYSLTTTDYTFNTVASSIYISVKSDAGTYYNSSVLFAAAVPTVTPTPAPTVAPGYVRNNLYVWDQNDAQISGADVDVLDVEAGTWTNTTADADGWITIDTLPYHTVNVYAHYPTSNIYLPNEILGLETGYYGGHNWVLVLYPYVTTPDGFVTLYINTRDYNSKAVLTNVNLQIKNLITGSTTGESTGSTDSVTTVVVNATNYQITGSKPGYLSKTIVINSGNLASKTVVVELSKATVTPAPTSTIPPGGIAPAITVDPNDPSLHGGDTSLKAQEMMTWLAQNGMMLVQLCFLVTIFALLGVKLGK